MAGNLLNLNKPLDFARATMGNVGGLLNLFGRDPKEWDLYEASYNDVIFHVFESAVPYGGAVSRVTDSGGRRKVKYQFPYKDGQTTDDLGRKPGSFQMEILLHGQNYEVALTKLLAQFDLPTPGDLFHPIRGEISCVVDDYKITYESSSRKAAAISVTFIEHNFSIGEFTSDLESTNKGALAKALAVFQKIDSIVLAVRGVVIFANNIKTKIEAVLAQYKSDSAVALQKMNVTFNKSSSVDIPSLLPTNQGGTTQGSTFRTVSSPSDPFASVPVSALKPGASPVASTVEELTKIVNTLRQNAQEIIDLIETSPTVTGAQTSGALELYPSILEMKQTVILMQQALETGVASSQARTILFTTPRLMTVREVAFTNGLTPDDGDKIALLNPSLLSLNFIDKGTVLKIPLN